MAGRHTTARHPLAGLARAARRWWATSPEVVMVVVALTVVVALAIGALR